MHPAPIDFGAARPRHAQACCGGPAPASTHANSGEGVHRAARLPHARYDAPPLPALCAPPLSRLSGRASCPSPHAAFSLISTWKLTRPPTAAAPVRRPPASQNRIRQLFPSGFGRRDQAAASAAHAAMPAQLSSGDLLRLLQVAAPSDGVNQTPDPCYSPASCPTPFHPCHQGPPHPDPPCSAGEGLPRRQRRQQGLLLLHKRNQLWHGA